MWGYGSSSRTSHWQASAHDKAGERVPMTFTNDMVSHVWAQQTQDFGRSGNGNLFFEGRALFSYGRHFVAGFIMPDGMALITTATYSPTTGGHVHRARYAVTRYVDVPDLTRLWESVLRSIPWDAPATWRPSRADKKAIREWLVNHPQTNREALEYLVQAFRLGPVADAIERAGAARVERRKKAELKQARADALRLLGQCNPAASANAIERALSDYDPVNTLTHLAKRIRSAQRTLTKARTPAAVWKRSQAFLKALEAEYGPIVARKKRKDRRHALQRAIADVRGFAEGFPPLEWREDATREGKQAVARHVASAYERFAQAMETISGGSGIVPAATRAKCREAMEWADEGKTAARAIAEAERLEAERETREAWMRGEPVRFYGRDANGRHYVRAIGVERDESGRIVGGTLQTSGGAEVPLRHAVRAFCFVKAKRDAGESWHTNGQTIRVGHFQVDSISATGEMRAGCHAFAWAEMERLATELGVADCQPGTVAE